MPELLCHLCGDYIIQNHWMANGKTRSSFIAAVHAASYTLPFLLLSPSWAAVAVIYGTHFVIDRWRLARLWVEFWGVGNQGVLWGSLSYLTDRPGWWKEPERAPDWMAVWLLIIADNTIHLTINHFALRWL